MSEIWELNFSQFIYLSMFSFSTITRNVRKPTKVICLLTSGPGLTFTTYCEKLNYWMWTHSRDLMHQEYVVLAQRIFLSCNLYWLTNINYIKLMSTVWKIVCRLACQLFLFYFLLLLWLFFYTCFLLVSNAISDRELQISST